MNLNIDKMTIVHVHVNYYSTETYACICMYMKLYVNYDPRLYCCMKYNN